MLLFGVCTKKAILDPKLPVNNNEHGSVVLTETTFNKLACQSMGICSHNSQSMSACSHKSQSMSTCSHKSQSMSTCSHKVAHLLYMFTG